MNMKKKIIAIACAVSILCSAFLLAGADTPADNPSINDVLEILKCLAKLPSEYDNSDLNPTMTDALNLLRYLAKLEETTDWVRPTSALMTMPLPATSATTFELSVCIAPDSFDSVEKFLEFVKNDEKINDSVLKDIYVPKNTLPGFELIEVTYDRNGECIVFIYEDKKYVYNEKFSRPENYELSTARYVLLLDYVYESGYLQTSLEQIYGWGMKPLTLEDRLIYYKDAYALSNVTVLMGRSFDFILNERRISAWLPAVDGLDVYDMVKYLEMIPVVSKEQSE
jgi:hypothetical protein